MAKYVVRSRQGYVDNDTQTCYTVATGLERDKRRSLHRSQGTPHTQLISALQGLRGVAFLSAVTIAAEVGDLRRFATPPQFMAYAGLVPSESSSGASRHRGPITKTGNSLLRHVLVEAAHHAWRPPRVSRVLEERQADLPQAVVDRAWETQLRLHHRYRSLAGRIGRPKTITAVARELAGFVWSIGQLVEEATAAA